MRGILLGSGGREHAEFLALSSHPQIQGNLLWAPGNAGVPGSVRRKLNINDFPAVVKLVHEEKCDFVCVGPEQPLCDGFVDFCAEHAPGIMVFGPNKAAAEFEADKQLLKRLAKAYDIRTSDYQVTSVLESVKRAIRDWGFPIVLKYPYLAAGKGVKVARDHSTATPFATEVLDGKFGHKKLLIEKFVSGRELSVFAMSNGVEGVPFGEACDYKLATDEPGEDRMIGGMGAYSPVPWVTPKLRARIKAEILDPLVRAMSAEGRPYRGVIYLGLMIDPEGNPWLLEVNCRLGDPEAQVVLPRLKAGVFAELLLWSVGAREKPVVAYNDLCAVCRVLCAKGYPDPYNKGYPIGGIEAVGAKGIFVIHAGTELDEAGKLIGVGGRVLGVLGLAYDMETARLQSQWGAQHIMEHSNFELRFRDDIAAGV